MIKLAMVRHGQTNFNLQRLVQGRIDNPLNKNGIEQAHLLADHLKEENKSFDAILSSPLTRALETAWIVAQTLNQREPIEIVQHFVERDFHDLDGKDVEYAWPLIRQKDYAHPGYETDVKLIERVVKAAFKLLEKHDGKELLCVAHSHVLKALLVYCNPNKFTFTNYKLTNGDVIYFEIDKNSIKFIEHIKHPKG